MLARTRRLDLFGFLVIGVVSGLGGGILRDTLLQHGTPVALTDYTYLTVSTCFRIRPGRSARAPAPSSPRRTT
ncbi:MULTISPECIES: trimeric intracellular cation channel family protein [Streptomyces]|uniref:trimeric intracellular cation channel family protein n=1 Tax=Streptomyces TaxID=1883 RepID=UPI0029A72C59|nr:TRIC cation channel family protein [Streptomyces sp. WI03-4A]MDX2596584.1 TRIC cation channel family protein [Streptomyces sp. WI03-4A]